MSLLWDEEQARTQLELWLEEEPTNEELLKMALEHTRHVLYDAHEYNSALIQQTMEIINERAQTGKKVQP